MYYEGVEEIGALTCFLIEGDKCPECGNILLERRSELYDDDLFLGCKSFPSCKFTSDINLENKTQRSFKLI